MTDGKVIAERVTSSEFKGEHGPNDVQTVELKLGRKIYMEDKSGEYNDNGQDPIVYEKIQFLRRYVLSNLEIRLKVLLMIACNNCVDRENMLLGKIHQRVQRIELPE